ncbi:hypothetical protein SPHINGO361_130288 [Sphingomonas sp. EC-HK361]|nr:hypothetical protein SPHINGO361_130288 [Sphingomonas sp. EC-HK361]
MGSVFALPDTSSRRGGRVVECTALEMRRALTGTVGSNPTLSAIYETRRTFTRAATRCILGRTEACDRR